MYDLHSHILPGFDDGACDPETSLKMLELAVEHGTREIVASPHMIEGEWMPGWQAISEACQELNNAADANHLAITVYPAAEVGLNYDLLTTLTVPGPYCINNGSYILVELPALELPSYIDDFFYTLQMRGFNPVIAHPERHPELAKDPEIVVELINKGILVQMNAGSLLGKMGKRTQETAELFLTHKMVHCMGSDAHGINNRRPIMDAAAKRIQELMGEEVHRQLVYINPEKIIHNQVVAVEEMESLKLNKLWGWFKARAK